MGGGGQNSLLVACMNAKQCVSKLVCWMRSFHSNFFAEQVVKLCVASIFCWILQLMVGFNCNLLHLIEHYCHVLGHSIISNYVDLHQHDRILEKKKYRTHQPFSILSRSIQPLHIHRNSSASFLAECWLKHCQI